MKYIKGFFEVLWFIISGVHEGHMKNIDQFYRLLSKKIPWLLVALFYILQMPFSIVFTLLLLLWHGPKDWIAKLLETDAEIEAMIEFIEENEE